MRAIVDDAETLKLMVRDGIGVALLPGDCVKAESAAGELHVVPMRRPLELALNMVRLDRPVPRAAARYFRLLRNGLADAGSWPAPEAVSLSRP